jgi:hypothetical protein
MANVVNAVDAVFKYKDKVLGCATSFDYTVTRDQDDATCSESDGWKQSSPGQKSWAASVSGVYRELTTAELATGVSYEDIFDGLDDGEEVTIEFAKKNGLGTRVSGKAYVSEVKFSRPEKGPITWSANFVGNGAITKTV